MQVNILFNILSKNIPWTTDTTSGQIERKSSIQDADFSSGVTSDVYFIKSGKLSSEDYESLLRFIDKVKSPVLVRSGSVTLDGTPVDPVVNKLILGQLGTKVTDKGEISGDTYYIPIRKIIQIEPIGTLSPRSVPISPRGVPGSPIRSARPEASYFPAFMSPSSK